MRVHNFGYLVKQGAKNIFTNKLMSFACIGVLVACLLLIGGAVLFSLNVNSMVNYVEKQNEFVAFLQDELTPQDIEVVDLALSSMDNIAQVRVITKGEALEQLKSRMGEDSSLMEALDGQNPLPITYVLRVNDVSKLEETVELVRGVEGIYKVNAQTEVAVILTGLKKTVNVAGASVVLILIIVSIVIITNTIKLTVFSRRKEINIMKYVGATDTFIRLPFLVEGMLIGLIAAIFAFLALGAGYTYLLQWVGEKYGEYIGVFYANSIQFRDIAMYILAGFSSLGVLIGVTGSGIFVRKYLKV